MEDGVFTRDSEMTFYDCDTREKAKLSTIARLFIEAAGKEYTKRGISHRQFIERRQVFLVSRLSLRIFERPKMDEIVTVRTWERGTQAVYFVRDYDMLDASGRVLVCGSSYWLMVDPVTRRLLRPAAFTAWEIPQGRPSSGAPECEKCLFSEDMPVVMERPVQYTDLDGNGHLYSGRYLDYATDALPAELMDKDVSECVINYNKEARLSDTLSLRRATDEDGSVRIWGKNGDENCFACRMTFGKA